MSEAAGVTYTVSRAQASTPHMLLIGPTPPPYHGVAVATQVLLDAKWGGCFKVLHLDLTDRRGIQHVDKPDLHDVWLFVTQWARLIVTLARYRPRLTYVPISQSTVGFLRDSLLIWPARWAGSQVVLHLHGANFRAWYDSRHAVVRAYVRAVLARAARMIVLGESLKPLFQGLIPGERIAVVPNGIGWNGSTATPRHAAQRVRVLYLGTLSRNKGVLWLLEAAAEVARTRDDVQFVFAGDWLSSNDECAAAALLAHYELRDAVAFVGPVHGAAKEQLFASADLFVFPGIQQEGQPLVVIEAMAAGLPVLFTNRGCLRDTVIDGEQGLEINAGDVADVAAKILWMLDHPGERQRMGASSRRRFEDCFTEQRFLNDMQGVFSGVVAEAARRRA
jgi:glycosyltransferase involved in cell wall biosynthesis